MPSDTWPDRGPAALDPADAVVIEGELERVVCSQARRGASELAIADALAHLAQRIDRAGVAREWARADPDEGQVAALLNAAGVEHRWGALWFGASDVKRAVWVRVRDAE